MIKVVTRPRGFVPCGSGNTIKSYEQSLLSNKYVEIG